MKVAVIKTPGSNCDQDAYFALSGSMGFDTEYVWHKATSLNGFDAVVLPGGFTYGDYLRGGAIAAVSPVIQEVKRFAAEGRPVLGICNGFQVLTEAGILPGALVKNSGQKFVCKEVFLKPDGNSHWTTGMDGTLKIPIAHNEGRFVADSDSILKLEVEGRIAFRYCTPQGEVTEGANPNGAMSNIAGITNERGNVLGMMPHPERAVSSLLGGEDGRRILERLAG